MFIRLTPCFLIFSALFFSFSTAFANALPGQPDAENTDRFGVNAWNAYVTAHGIAIRDALAARQDHDTKRLDLAYAKNNVACHYLADLFAAGHLRTPRTELPAHITPGIIGDILSGYMHDEENYYGIMVHNRNGDHWIAYGDQSPLSAVRDNNEKWLQSAVKLSTMAIFQSYMTGKDPDPNNEKIDSLLPKADETGNAANNDISPMFYWDASTQHLMRRQNLSNPYDRHWTAAWWGWTTLAELSQQKKLSTLAQTSLALSGFGEQALQMGLITDKQIMLQVNKTRR